MKRSLRVSLSVSLLCHLCLAAGQLHASAQSTNILAGQVTDSRGAAVAGATVTLYARESDGRRTTLTDAGGNYHFEAAGSGDYVVAVASGGFGSVARAVRVESGRPARLDFTLQPAGPSEAVLVTAAGTPQTVDEVSKAVSVVSAQEVERRGEYSVAESLRTVPGLRVQQLGGPGTFTRIQTRGLRDSDTAVLVDGLRLRDAASAQGDATGFVRELFVVSPERLEVVRGSGSSLYGTNAIGGVVNVISDQGGGPTHGQLQFEAGQLGLFRGRAQLAGGLDKNRFVYSGGLSLFNVRGGVNHTPARSNGGQWFARYDFTPNLSLSARILGDTAFLQQTDSPFAPPAGVTLPPRGSVVNSVALPLEQQRRMEARQPETPAGDANFVPNLRDPDNRSDSGFLTLAVTLTHRVSDSLGYRASYQRVSTNRQFNDGPAGARFEPLFNSFSNFGGRIDTLNLGADVKLGRHSRLTFGYEFERERYAGRDRDENPNPALRTDAGTEVEQRSNAFFVQNQFRALNNRFQAAAAFRVQAFSLRQPEFTGGTSVYTGRQFESPKTAHTGDGSVSYFFDATGTKLRAHVGSGYRAPSPFERFGSFIFGGVFSPFGDPRLRPERSVAADGGVDQRLAGGRVLLSATYFYTRLQEVIVFDSAGFITPSSDPFGRSSGYRNTGGGLARGAEFSVNSKPYRTLDLSASYTYTDAVNSVASSVPGFLRTFGQPRHAFTLVALQQITPRLDVAFDLFAYGSYFTPFSGRAFKFRGPARADLGSSYTLTLNERFGLRFYGKVENLFDREYFESGFRTPGAAFTCGTALRF